MGARLDVWLAAQDQPHSRSQVHRRIAAGEVSVNGEAACEPSRKLRDGDVVVLVPPPPARTEDLAEDIPFVVLFEDRHLVVLDKPAGLVVHPATSHESGTLVNALLHHCGGEQLAIAGERRPGIVHRLDKDTSGVMVVAKDEPTLTGLQEQFAAHDLKRSYLALVDGVIAESGTFDTKHGRDPRDRKRYTSRKELLKGQGRRAVTHWKVRERLAGATLVEVTLETGRTHQIRVHFRDHGHPVVGDPVYGKPSKNPLVREVGATLGRQALHAAVLGFRHPITGAWIEQSTEMPEDMRQAIEPLR